APPPASQKARNDSRYDSGWTRVSSSSVARRGSRLTTASRNPASSMPARAACTRAGRSGCWGPTSWWSSAGEAATRSMASLYVRAGERDVRAGERDVRAGERDVRAGERDVRAGERDVRAVLRAAAPARGGL